ncbi:UNVERIFIED_CONTAM: hypothetical protein Slati_4579700 [Sesamum latifolium]|uniref:Uncharacterized protein n=1 Tax=Sesamum latifolium TaxID=2727402 RepID=A0AAW2SHW5_9LAMI
MVVTGGGELGVRFREGSLRNGYHTKEGAGAPINPTDTGGSDINNIPGSTSLVIGMKYNLNPNEDPWRASLVPAPGIPAPIAYLYSWLQLKSRSWTFGWAGRRLWCHRSVCPSARCAPGLNWPGSASGSCYFEEKSAQSKPTLCITLAWK